MKKSDFYFDCPVDLIADYPLSERTASRLLYVPEQGAVQDRIFTDITQLLRQGDLLVLNDTRVIRARLFGHKLSGGKVEILIERMLTDTSALAHIKANKSLRAGTELQVDEVQLQVTGRQEDLFKIKLLGTSSFFELLERHGQVPLPIYIHRNAEADDDERYQTIYAKHPGSVAAPTAGLHFDEALLNMLKRKGVAIEALTLHIGAGTFQPLRTEQLTEHNMHKERVIISERLCDAVNQCHQRKGRVIAVGSTVLRALETAADESGKLHTYDGETDLFIYPGYRFKVADVLITNFHLSESTLFILICAFAQRQRMLSAYQHAIDQRYRFFSYGDAMYLERNDAVHD